MERSAPWLMCFEEAWAAYAAGSVPIGAAFVSDDGRLCLRGRNRIGEQAAPPPFLSHTRLAHAEMNVLVQARPQDVPVLGAGTLYTTLEPCLLCFGAAVMSGVGCIHYAARDNEAGATQLSGASRYLRAKRMTIRGPEPLWGALSLALMTDHMLRADAPRLPDFVMAFRAEDPAAVELGEEWFRKGYLRRQARRGVPVTAIISEAFRRLRAPRERPRAGGPEASNPSPGG